MHHSMKAYGGVKVQFHLFLTSAVDGSGWSASGFGHVVPGVHLVGDWWAPKRVCIWWQTKKKECLCRELNLLLGSKIL